MIDVVCFCGFGYSFAGEDGACPRCGEYIAMTRASAADEQQMRDDSHCSSRELSPRVTAGAHPPRARSGLLAEPQRRDRLAPRHPQELGASMPAEPRSLRGCGRSGA